MNPRVLAVMFLVLIVLAYQLARNYQKGLALAAALLVSLSHHLMLVTPGNLPNFPIHRLIIILLLAFWLPRGQSLSRIRQAPYLLWFVLLGLTNLISVVFGLELVNGIKEYLSFTFEFLLFYLMTVTSLGSRADALRVIRYVWIGFCVVAVIAIFERRTGTNPMEWIIPDYKAGYPYDILSTYPHRILFGAAMAMAFPIALILPPVRRWQRWTYLFSAFLIAAACYFSVSRGPWLGALVGVLILTTMGSLKLKKIMLVIFLAVIAVFIIRPGVWGTIRDLAEDTADSSTAKGSTFHYRMELWKVAYREVTKSPVRFLWGYGPGSTGSLNLERDVDEGAKEYWSWDNHYAWLLLETGFLGLGAALMLYTRFMVRMVRIWRRLRGVDRTLLVGLISSMMVLLFMMTNVMIFAQHLFYLFWILASVAVTLERTASAQAAPAGADVENRPIYRRARAIRRANPWTAPEEPNKETNRADENR